MKENSNHVKRFVLDYQLAGEKYVGNAFVKEKFQFNRIVD